MVEYDRFAGGHVGGLTQLLGAGVVDEVVRGLGLVGRVRVVPLRVAVYFVLVLGVFPGLGYGLVWSRLSGGVGGVSGKVLRVARDRVGVGVMRVLFERFAGCLGSPQTPGAFHQGLRLVSFDGCSSVRVPDSVSNRRWLGKLAGSQGSAGYPVVGLMTLVECATRSILGAVISRCPIREVATAQQLLHLVQPGMLVLADRGFDAVHFFASIADTGAHLLIRISNSRTKYVVLAHYDDGSMLIRLTTNDHHKIDLRLITATLHITLDDATTTTSTYRLVTTLLNPRDHTATSLLHLYHQRWEHETTYHALKNTIMHGRVLRSHSEHGIRQELWALLLLYQLIRTLMHTTITTSHPTLDPTRASFKTALTATETTITTGTTGTTYITTAILTNLLPPRRRRTVTRKTKTPISRYATQQPNKPKKTRKITKITYTTPNNTTTPQKPNLTKPPPP